MLDPEYLDRAGDMVAAVYGEIEAEMLDSLCRMLLDQDLEELGQRGATALNLLAQSAAPRLMACVERHREDANRAVLRTVEDALGRSDRADLAGMPKAARDAAGRTLPRQVELTARGIAEILERDNVDMAQGALSLWNRCVAEAATQVNTGAETAERAIHRAVRRMMREGVSTIAYRDAGTGRQTVVNRVDVAVRRHVRTQIAQDGMRRTLEVCEGAGIRLVEVSSHGGSRPEHARWQGRVYSLGGEVEIDGVRYKDFYSETGYGKVDGLGGANCRHSFGPWIPGTARTYSPDPAHPSGLPSDEVYAMGQGQRAREREIRRTKRELAGAQLIADKDPSMANVAEAERLKRRLSDQQKAMRDYISECNSKGKKDVLQRSPRREWAGDMPRIRKSDAMYMRYRAFPQAIETLQETRGIKRLGRERINGLQRDSDAAFSDMSVAQLQTTIDYTRGAHNVANQMLYGRKQTKRQAEKAEELVKHLDGALGKFRLREDVVVFSGTKASHYDEWKIGEEREIAGYLSASVRLRDTKPFCSRALVAGSSPMIITVLVPKTTPCLFIGENTAFRSYQGELLLKHGLKYKVLSKTESTMTLEVVR